MVSVADGYWIGALGSIGYVGFACTIAFLVVPLFMFSWNRARMSGTGQILLGGLALIVAFHALDVIPNNSFFYLSLAWAGALYSLSQRLRNRPSRRDAGRPASTIKGPRQPPLDVRRRLSPSTPLQS